MPRNVGIRFSRGEYILFVDSDDAITPTALEELYPIAKEFDADFVYCEKYYDMEAGKNFTTDKNLLKESVIGNIKYDYVNKPTIVPNDIARRLNDLLSLRFYVVPWNYLIRRDFISQHKIFFPDIKYGEDNMFVLYLVCRARNVVRVPNVIYIHRTREGSIGTNKSLEIDIRRYTDHVFQGISIISKFAKEFIFLNEHPEFKYAIFNFLASSQFGHISHFYAQIPAWQLEPLIINELNKIEDKTPLTAFLFSRMAIFNLQLNQYGAIIQQQQAKINELQRRLYNIQ